MKPYKAKVYVAVLLLHTKLLGSSFVVLDLYSHKTQETSLREGKQAENEKKRIE